MVKGTRVVRIHEKHLEELSETRQERRRDGSFPDSASHSRVPREKGAEVKQPYFCQTNALERGHKSKHFSNIEDGRKWLAENGSGSIQRRKVIPASEHGLGRVVFDPPRRVWGGIATVEAQG